MKNEQRTVLLSGSQILTLSVWEYFLNDLRQLLGKIVTNKPNCIRISLRGVNGETVRLNLSLDVFSECWHIYRDGQLSKSHPHASSTVVAQQLQKWLIGQANAVRESRNNRQKAGTRCDLLSKSSR